MHLIHLEQISINADNISFIEWGSEDTPKEAMPGGNTTELANPNNVPSPHVVLVRFVGGTEATKNLTIDRQSKDFETLKAALFKT